jgi:hypothetical protein
MSVVRDASLPSTTTYSSEGGNPTAIEILHKEEIILDPYLGGTVGNCFHVFPITS